MFLLWVLIGLLDYMRVLWLAKSSDNFGLRYTTTVITFQSQQKSATEVREILTSNSLSFHCRFSILKKPSRYVMSSYCFKVLQFISQMLNSSFNVNKSFVSSVLTVLWIGTAKKKPNKQTNKQTNKSMIQNYITENIAGVLYFMKCSCHDKYKKNSFVLQITFLTVFPLQQGVAEIPPAFSVHCNVDTKKLLQRIYTWASKFHS